MKGRPEPVEAAAEILAQRYASADSVLLAGSTVRGEATSTSDLDLVVLFPTLERSYRESFEHRGWPVEVLAHDTGTLEYYFEKDRASGVGTLMWMVSDGIAVPGETELNRRVKARAAALLAAGPLALTVEEIDYARYTITGLLDDLSAPRNDAEYRAIVVALFPALANHYLRARGHWGATAKTIPRRLAAADAKLAAKFDTAFGAAFSAEPMRLFAIADEILQRDGGRLFEGYRSVSDINWRRTPPTG